VRDHPSRDRGRRHADRNRRRQPGDGVHAHRTRRSIGKSHRAFKRRHFRRSRGGGRLGRDRRLVRRASILPHRQACHDRRLQRHHAGCYALLYGLSRAQRQSVRREQDRAGAARLLAGLHPSAAPGVSSVGEIRVEHYAGGGPDQSGDRAHARNRRSARLHRALRARHREMSRYGVIAGNGRFPVLVLEAARRLKDEVVAIGIREEASPEIEKLATRCHWISLGQLSRLIEICKAEGVSEIMMAGQVKHASIFSSIRPDWRLFKLLAALREKNTDSLIGAVQKVLEDEGIRLTDSTTLLKPLLAAEGAMTPRRPSAEEEKDAA